MRHLDIWVIYDNPIDFPGYYVARLHQVMNGTCNPVDAYIKHVSLNSLRNMLPPGLVCIKRSDSDPPPIVESWV